MSRALRRLAKRAERKPGRKKQCHYSGDDLIERRGYGALARVIPVTETELHRYCLGFYALLERCRSGEPEKEDSCWSDLMGVLITGYICARATTQPVNLSRQFQAAGALLDSSYVHWQKTHQILETNFEVVHQAIDDLCDIVMQLRRDELMRVNETMRNDTIGIYRDFFNDPRAFTAEDAAFQAWMARQ